MNGENKIISANTQKININSYTGGDLKVSNKTLTPNINKINHDYNIEQMSSNEGFNDANLVVEEFSFEELLKAGEQRYDEIQEQLAKNQAEADKFEDKVKNVSGTLDQKELDELWRLYNSLTDEQKELVDPNTKALLEQMEKDYRNRLAHEAKIKEEREKQEAELELLYKARDDNNGLFNPKKEAEIESQILALEKKLGVAHKPDGWESFCDTVESAGAHAVTFVASAVEGFVDLGEGVIDGTIYGAAKTLQLFGVDDKWAEDIIAYDVSGKMYDSFVDATGIDKDIAYGPAHTYGNFAGEMGGYYALSAVPFVGTALCCIGGAGSAVEDSINRQLEENGEVNDLLVFGESALGALEGFGFGKAAQGAKAGFKAIKDVGLKNVFKQTIGSISKESIKQTAKQSGKIALHTAGHTLTDADLYVETASVLGDDIFHGIETGEWDFEKMAGEAAVVVGENYVQNLTAGMWSANSNINKDLRKTAATNYKEHSGDFTSKPAYYADLAYGESNNYWITDANGKSVHVVLDPDDPGITRSLTNEAKANWQKQLDSVTDFATNTSRVNLAHTNSQVFNDFVVGNDSNYGQFGMPNNYNFGRMGEATPDAFVNSASINGKDLITQYKTDTGIPLSSQKTDRIIFCSHDVPTADISMHTGKELNSYSERLPGGRLPNGDYEVSYKTQKITTNSANSTKIIVKDSSGKDIWSGSLFELKGYQQNNPDLYRSIVFG